MLFPCKAKKIAAPFSLVSNLNDEKSKDFYNAIDSEYYYLKRNGDRYRLNEIEQTESFSVNYCIDLLVNMEFIGEKKEGASMQGAGALLLQGIATSIDALSVGFTIADADFAAAGVESLIIGAVTFFLCCCGVAVGKRFGARFADHASILGGVILIGIGVEILIKGLLAGQ